MNMSTLPMTATASAVGRDVPNGNATTASLVGRVLDAWSRYQARIARAHVDQQLQRFSDEELKEMGYGGVDVARIRSANENVPQHWL